MRKAAIVAFGLAGAVWGTDGLTADSPLRAIKRPSPEEIATASPDKGEIGKGLFRCVVTVEGVLQDCAVEGESPVGVGFGAAAIGLAPLFQFAPPMTDGHLKQRVVHMTIDFTPSRLDAKPTDKVARRTGAEGRPPTNCCWRGRLPLQTPM